MAQRVTAFAAKGGNLFTKPDDATVSELTELLGNNPFARTVFAKRKEIEDIFTQHDRMLDQPDSRMDSLLADLKD